MLFAEQQSLLAFVCLWTAWQAPHWKSRLPLICLAALLLLIALVIPPNFVPARVSIPNYACRANLRRIQGAKETWAMDLKKGPAEIPRPADLVGPDKYLRDNPVCPLGGAYHFRAVREKPTCSMGLSHPGHRYGFDQ